MEKAATRRGAEAEARACGLLCPELAARIEQTENHPAIAAPGYLMTSKTAPPGYDRPLGTTTSRIEE